MATEEQNTEEIEVESSYEIFLSKVRRLPTKPGIYQYKNSAGIIIYVGKAKNLRNRVRSYFQDGRPVDAKTKALVRHIADFEVIVTDSEAEALLLEDTLIKKHKPKYNIMLRDDKSYPYVRVTNEPFPRIFATRKVIRDGSKYYGPFTEAGHLKHVLKTLRALFLFRSCDFHITDDTIEKKKYKLCLDFHIKKCEGPCEGLVPKEKYQDNVRQAIQVLNGKTKDLEKKLEKEMEELSEEMRFEEAAIVRNRYLILKEYLSHQKIITTELIDRDIIGLARYENGACTLVFKVRDGKLIGKRHYIITNAEAIPDEELIQTTLEKWYQESEFVPKEIIVPIDLPEPEFIISWLKELRGSSVELLTYKTGDKKKLVAMASANAEFQLREYFLAMEKRKQNVSRGVLSLQRDLRLSKIPARMECFDNSHIQGTELVSSCVVFVDGKPKKSDYRKFKIKTVGKNDDFAAMQEVVRRRYNHSLDKNDPQYLPLPDLIIIDGGKGQLSSAVEILEELGILNKVIVISLAKRIDEVFFPGVSESVILPKSSSSLKLIQQIRDEAHRFAITYHRLLRDKRTLQTGLTEIAGIGEKTAQKLLIEFGSVAALQSASIEKLTESVGAKTAKSLIEYFDKLSEESVIEKS
jgi:excinuclease ABC subunit C